MLKLQSIAALIFAALFVASCGGSVQDLADIDSNPDSGFTALRYNSSGVGDPSLGNTVDLKVEQRGNQTSVRIAIDDSMPMENVVVYLNYDESRYSPVSTDYMGLMDDCIEYSISDVAGLVALSQTSFGPATRHRGQFAEVVFAHRPMTHMRKSSIIHNATVDATYHPPQITSGRDGFQVTKATADDGDPATFIVYSVFATADGDDNSETNLSDITPMISYGNFTNSVSNGNFGPAATDYDANGEANLADIAKIAIHFSNRYTGVEILLGNTPTLTSANVLRELTYDSGTPADHSGAPFTTTSWTDVFRSWNDTITIDEMIAVDADEDGTVYISARVTDGTDQGDAFAGRPLTFEVGPPVITDIQLDFPGSAGYVQDPPGSGNYLVYITEKSVDDIEDNNEDFAPESLGVEATVTIEGEPTPVQDNLLVLWNVVEGSGLGNVDSLFEKGKVTFTDRGRLTVQAQAIGDFNVTGEITFLLCSIDSIVLELGAGGAGPADVNSGDTVQLMATGTFDWDSVDNSNEIEMDITSFCNWAALADGTNTGSFVVSTDDGSVNTTSADSGDSVRVTCEFPGTDNVTIFDNMKRTSNFFRVNIN